MQTAALLSLLMQARGPLLQAVEAPGFQDRLVRHGGRYAQALRQRAVLAEVVAGLQSTDPSELAGPRHLAIGAAWVRRHQSSASAQKDTEANLGCVCALHKPMDDHACMLKRDEDNCLFAGFPHVQNKTSGYEMAWHALRPDEAAHAQQLQMWAEHHPYDM